MFIKNSIFRSFIMLLVAGLFFLPFSATSQTAQITSPSGSNPVCSGSNIVLAISGGVAPYTITYYVGPNRVVVSTPTGTSSPFQLAVDNPFTYQTSVNLSTVVDANGTFLQIQGNSSLQMYAPVSATWTNIPFLSCTPPNYTSVNNLIGTAPFTFTINDGSSDYIIPDRAANNTSIILGGNKSYSSLRVQDANGCTAAVAGSFTTPPGTINLSGPIINGTCSASITITNPKPGLSYGLVREGVTLNLGGPSFPIYQGGKYYVLGFNPGNFNFCPEFSDVLEVSGLSGQLPPAIPVVVSSNGTSPACGQSAILSVSSGAYDQYTWLKNDVVVQDGPSSTLAVNTSGAYQVSVKVNGGCPSPYSAPLQMSFVPGSSFIIPVITSSANVINCWETATLSVPNIYDTYQWFNGTAISGATSNTYVTSQPGNYKVYVTSGSCDAANSAIQSLSVNPLPQPVLSRSGFVSIPFNSGQNTIDETSGFPYDAYEWQTSPNGSTFTSIPGATGPGFTFTTTGVYYRLKVTRGSCSAFSGSFFPTVSNPPNYINLPNNGSTPMVMCLANAKISMDPGFAYAWYKGGVLIGGETSAVLDLSKPGLGTGIYRGDVTDNFGLTYISSTRSINVLADITPALSIYNPRCSGELGAINANTLNSFILYKTYTFKDDQGNIIPSPATSSVNNIPPGNYTVTVEDWAGCTATASATIVPSSGIPDFTPVIQSNATSVCRTYDTAPGITLSVSNLSSLPPVPSGSEYNYQWFLNGVAYFDPLAAPNSSTITAKQSGTYTLVIREYPYFNPGNPLPPPVTWTPTKCFGVSNGLNLTVNNVIADFTLTPVSGALCPDSDLKITFTGNASATASYTWDFPDASPSTAVGRGPHIIKYSTGGWKTATLTIEENGCSSGPRLKGTQIIVPDPISTDAIMKNIYAGCYTNIYAYGGAGLTNFGPWTPSVASTVPEGLPPASYPAAYVNPTETTTYTITATDRNNCPTSGSITINVMPVPNTGFTYSAPAYCQTTNSAVPVVLNAGAVKGNFSFTPSGLNFSAYDGTIYPSASSPGVYTVTNTINTTNVGFNCPVMSSSAVVSIIKRPLAAYFNYPNGQNLCTSSLPVSPVFTTSGDPGTFTVAPATGLDLNASTGTITPQNSVAGFYTIRHTPATDATCVPVYTETIVRIYTLPKAGFTYPVTATPYCNNNSISVLPTFINGGTAGQFSSNTGLSVNAATGAFSPLNAAGGIHTVTNTIYSNGACPTVTASATVLVSANKPAGDFSYYKTIFCEGEVLTIQPSISGIAGTFTASPAGLVINSTNGALTIGTSMPGTYTISNTVNADPGCTSNARTKTITIIPKPVISLSSIPNSSVCAGSLYTANLTNSSPGSSFTWTATGSGSTYGYGNGSGSTISQALYGAGTVTYRITPTFNLCPGTPTDLIITVNAYPSLNNPGNKVTCSGMPLSIPLSASIAGSAISWTAIVSSGTVTGFNAGNGSAITDVLTGSGVVRYDVNVSKNGCSTTSSFFVTVNESPAVTTTVPAEVCEGAQFTYSFTKPSNYTNTVPTNISSAYFSTISTAPPTATGGTYTLKALAVPGADISLTVTNPSTGNVLVTVNPNLASTLTVTPTTLCQGTALNVTRVTPAGYNINYTRPAHFTMITNTTSAPAGGNVTYTEADFAGASDGVFSVTTTTPFGCSRTYSVPVTVKPAPGISVMSSASICEGEGFDIPLFSSTPGATFNWTVASVTGTIAGHPVSGTTDHIIAPAGSFTGNGTITYKANSLLDNGCTSPVMNIVVTVKPNLESSLTVTPTLVCEGASVGVSKRYPVGYSVVYTRPAGFSRLGGGGGSDGVTIGEGESVTAGSQSGDFTFVVTAPWGCVRSHSVHVDVNPAPDVSASNLSICEGTGFNLPISSTTPGVTYTWAVAGNSGTIAGYPVSGTSSQIIGDAAALTGNGTITYRVNSVLTSTGCFSANLFVTVVVNPNLPSSLSITPTSVCEGSTVVAGVDYPVGYSLNYIRAAGFIPVGGAAHSSPGYTGFNEGLTAGPASDNFQIIVTSPAGCIRTVSVPVTVLPAPGIAASNISICEGSGFDIPLSGTSAVSYQWSLSSVTGTVAGYPASGTANHINAAEITGNGTITYNVKSISAANCSSAGLLVTVTVNPNGLHDAGFYVSGSNTQLPNPTTLCQGSTFSFAARIPLNSTYTYTPPPSSDFQNINGGGDNNGFGRQYIAISGNDGLFTYTTVSDLGCTRTSQYIVHVNPAPPAPVIHFSSSSANAICAGSSGSIGYNIEAGISYDLSYDAGLIANTGMCGQGPTSYGCSVTWGNGDGFLTVTGTNQWGCSTTSIMFVPVQSTPVINPVTPDPLCSGSVTSIVLNSVPNFSTIKYEWESFVSAGTINGKNSFENVSSGVVFAGPGFGYTIQETLSGNGTVFYNVTATTQSLSGCSSQTTIYQDVIPASAPSVTVSYSPNTSIPQMDQIVFTAAPVNCGSNPHYQWKVNGVNVIGATGSTYQNPNLIFSARGTIPDRVSCTVTSSDVCSNGVQVTSPEVVIGCSLCKMAASLTPDSLTEAVVAYPNPFSESIHVNISGSFGEEVELVIKDMKGIEVERFSTSTGEADLGLGLESGVYILQVVRKSGTGTFKIVKTQ